MQILRRYGINLKFIRTLGAGGNGFATLFELQHLGVLGQGPAATPPAKKFVMKTALEDGDMSLEKFFMAVSLFPRTKVFSDPPGISY